MDQVLSLRSCRVFQHLREGQESKPWSEDSREGWQAQGSTLRQVWRDWTQFEDMQEGDRCEEKEAWLDQGPKEASEGLFCLRSPGPQQEDLPHVEEEVNLKSKPKIGDLCRLHIRAKDTNGLLVLVVNIKTPKRGAVRYFLFVLERMPRWWKQGQLWASADNLEIV